MSSSQAGSVASTSSLTLPTSLTPSTSSSSPDAAQLLARARRAIAEVIAADEPAGATGGGRLLQTCSNCKKLKSRPASFLAQSASQASPYVSAPLKEEEDELSSVLTNPLTLLAIASEESSAASQAAPAPAPPSLFDHILDADPSLDPINMGLLLEEDFERLLAFYFGNQQLYLQLFDPTLHTSYYIRRTSPFLTTAIALVAAPFDPLVSHAVPALEAHARRLSSRAFIEGYKSMEVVLAYTLLFPWSAAVDRPSDDRAWTYSGVAARYAGEIGLNLPLRPTTIKQYENLLAPLPVSAELLNQARLRIFESIFCINLALSIQTGRLAEALTLHAALCKSTMPPAEIRETFNASWKANFAQYDSRFGSIKGFPYLSRIDRSILLLSYSLHFEGPSEPILEECKQLALEGVRYATEWYASDARLLYTSNFTITTISYFPSFLLRNVLKRRSSANGEGLDDRAIELCWEIVRILECISGARMHGRSVAADYARQIRRLLAQLQPQPSLTLPNLSTTTSASPSTTAPDFDFSPAAFSAFSSFEPLSAPYTTLEGMWPPSGEAPSWPANEGYYDELFTWLPAPGSGEEGKGVLQ
ncbi:hypothetical protein JCM8547_005193 [Rhodosporidiobolus lusitaniae]